MSGSGKFSRQAATKICTCFNDYCQTPFYSSINIIFAVCCYLLSRLHCNIAIIKLSQRMEKRVNVTNRVKSAPEVRALTPPTLHRSKQGCPLTFSDLLRAEEVRSCETLSFQDTILLDTFRIIDENIAFRGCINCLAAYFYLVSLYSIALTASIWSIMLNSISLLFAFLEFLSSL